MTRKLSRRSGALPALLVPAVLLTACGGESVEAPVPMPVPVDTVAAGPIGEPVDEEATAPAGDTADVEVPEPKVRDPAPEPEPEPAKPRREARNDRPAVPTLPGAIMPRERIVAFYGNPASTRMGILGELPPDEMLSRLDREVARWREADPSTPVRPALHMIAVMAAGDPGVDSLYRVRMPSRRIESVLAWADRRNAITFLDIQPGLSSVQSELPRLRDWLARPDVHLALDPEWDMADGARPGTRIGSMTASDINYAIDFLARLVDEHDLPPKVLVVHRFTQAMVRNAEDIRLDPRVQVVINMDGWGPPSQKRYAYREIVAPEATQFTGFKLFFKNDLRNGSRLMTPEEILELSPAPFYIQYQ